MKILPYSHFAKVVVFAAACFLFSCQRDQNAFIQKPVKSILILEDCQNQYSIENILEKDLDSEFVTLPDEHGLSEECVTYWLKVTFRSDLIGEELVLPLRHVDILNVYSEHSSLGFVTATSGENINFAQRQIPFGELPVVSFKVPESGTVYFQLIGTSYYSRSFRSISALKFEFKESFLNTIDQSRYFHGIFLGVMVAMMIYNLFIYFVYKDSMYLVYTVFMFSQTIYHLSITGFLREFFFPNLPLLAKYAPFFIAGLSLICFIWFSQVYLVAKKYAPKLNLALNILTLFIILTTSIGFFYKIQLANSILLLSGVVMISIAFAIAIVAYRKKYRPAIFFLIASVLAYFGYFLFTMSRLGFIPSVFVTRYSFQILVAVQSLLFALGLGDRMNRIKKELAINKIRQANLKREKEAELKRVLERQNEVLEKKVIERTSELEEKNRIVEQDREIILEERQKSDKLLRNILPDSIASRLKSGEEMIADHFDEVSVFFSDIVGFTHLSKSMKPNDLVNLLNELFSEFDALADLHGLEKIKTIGDAYMCVSGLPIPAQDHATKMASFAIDIVDKIQELNKKNNAKLAVRIGVHSGPVVAGVIGHRKFAYDLWGETVNIASRLETQGVSMKIYCSEEFKNLVGAPFEFDPIGKIELKGIGPKKVFHMRASKINE